MDFSAGIKINVLGMSQVDRLLSKTSSLSNLVDKLNATPVTLNTGKADAEISKALKSMNDFTRGVVNGTKQLANNEAGLQEQIAALRQYSANLALGTKNGAERTNAIQAQVKAEQKLTLAGFERIEAEARLLAIGKQVNNESFKGVAELIKFEGQVGKNTRSLELYAQVLKDTLGFVRIGSQDYLDLSAAIARVNTQLRQAQTLAQKPVATTQFAQPIGPQPLQLSRQVRTPLNVNAPQGRGIGPALIGGAFPLLFGGGPGSAIGGFVGELAGPLGGVVGSAVGMQFDALAEQAINLGRALDPLTADFDVLVNRLGAVGTPLESIIESYKELEEEGKALELSTEQLAELVGNDGVKALQDFSDGTVKVQSAFSKLLTQMLALLAEAFNQLPGRFAENIERAVLLGQAEKSTDPAIQELVRQREASRSGSLGQKDFLGILRGGDPQEFARLTEEVINKQRELNKLSFDQLVTLGESLKKRVAEKDLAKQQAKEAVQALDIQKQALENNLAILQNTLGVEQERNNLAISKISLNQTLSDIRLKDFEFIKAAREAGLSELEQLKLMGLERLNSLNIEERLALVRKGGAAIAREEEEILKKQFTDKLKAAKLEYDSQLLSIDASVSKAKIEQQITQIQSQQLQVQVTSLKIQAQAIENAEERAAALARANREQALVNQQTAEIERLARNNLSTAIKQADIQRQIAGNKYEELKATIQSEELERRRSKVLSEIEAKSARIAQNTRETAAASNQISSTAGGSGGLGSTTTQTISTSMPIDPDVRKAVMDRAPAFGYRSIYELIEKLEEAQKLKNARTTRTAQMSQPSSSSFASSSSYAPRSSSGSSSGTTSVNISTGPVLEFDGKRYMTMDDFERGVAELAGAQAQRARSYGSRRYGGIS